MAKLVKWILLLIIERDAMSSVIKYTVNIKPPYNKSLQCKKCNEYVWFPFWGYIFKSKCNCKRLSKYD